MKSGVLTVFFLVTSVSSAAIPAASGEDAAPRHLSPLLKSNAQRHRATIAIDVSPPGLATLDELGQAESTNDLDNDGTEVQLVDNREREGRRPLQAGHRGHDDANSKADGYLRRSISEFDISEVARMG